MDNMYATGCGIQVKVLKNKGALNFGVTDIFDHQRFRGVLGNDENKIDFMSRWESNQYTISFTYQFSNNKIKRENKFQEFKRINQYKE